MNKLPTLSTRQFFRYLARYVRHSPSATRAVPPSNKIRFPQDPGVGIFLYPPSSWVKTSILTVGPLGETRTKIHPSKFELCRPVTPSKSSAPEILYWGFGGAVRVTKNALSGVTEGFAVTLELHGVGFRVEREENRDIIVFRLGLSHTVEMPVKNSDGDVFFNVINPQLLQVAGTNREKVHQMAAKVRDLRPPEPYKGKGIRYKSEPIRRKETKKD